MRALVEARIDDAQAPLVIEVQTKDVYTHAMFSADHPVWWQCVNDIREALARASRDLTPTRPQERTPPHGC